MMICAASGTGIVFFIRGQLKKTIEKRKLAEVAVLYETVDFYTQAGYTVFQSMEFGAALTLLIKPAINRCLSAWPQGPNRALNRMADELNMPQASLLATILMYIEEAGVEMGRSSISEEAKNLEALRLSLSSLTIVSKPLYYSIYRALPLAGVGGVVVGPLTYQLVNIMTTAFNL